MPAATPSASKQWHSLASLGRGRRLPTLLAADAATDRQGARLRTGVDGLLAGDLERRMEFVLPVCRRAE